MAFAPATSIQPVLTACRSSCSAPAAAAKSCPANRWSLPSPAARAAGPTSPASSPRRAAGGPGAAARCRSGSTRPLSRPMVTAAVLARSRHRAEDPCQSNARDLRVRDQAVGALAHGVVQLARGCRLRGDVINLRRDRREPPNHIAGRDVPPTALPCPSHSDVTTRVGRAFAAFKPSRRPAGVIGVADDKAAGALLADAGVIYGWEAPDGHAPSIPRCRLCSWLEGARGLASVPVTL